MDYRQESYENEIVSKGYSLEDAKRALKTCRSVGEALRSLEKNKYPVGAHVAIEVDRQFVNGTVHQIEDFGRRIVRIGKARHDYITISVAELDIHSKRYTRVTRDRGSRDRGTSQGYRDRNDRVRQNDAPPRYSDAPPREPMRKEKKYSTIPPRDSRDSRRYEDTYHGRDSYQERRSQRRKDPPPQNDWGGPSKHQLPPSYQESLQEPMGTFIPHMKMEEAKRVCHINAKIDHQDTVGHFLPATIIDKNGTNCHISYDGWKDKWNTWSDYTKEIERFAKLGSISDRPATRPEEQLQNLDIDDIIDVCSPRHPGWVKGTIRRLDIDKPTKRRKSGQVQVQYRAPNASSEREFLYWVHIDDIRRVQPFATHSCRNYGDDEEEVPPHQDDVMGGAAGDQEVRHNWTKGDWADVKDERNRWCPAEITNVRGNKLYIHFADWSPEYDTELCAVKDAHRIRPLGAGLSETDNEKEIRELMVRFTAKLKQQDLEIREVAADGNCLYRGFAVCIYGREDEHERVRQECCEYMHQQRQFFENFIPDFDETMALKNKQYEWGDHVDIIAMSELYNVRVHIYEYDKEADVALRTLASGGELNLPIVMLSRHREKHYNILHSSGRPNCVVGDNSNARVSIKREREMIEETNSAEDVEDSKLAPMLSSGFEKRTSSLRSSIRIKHDLDLTDRDMRKIMLSNGLEGVNIPTSQLPDIFDGSVQVLEMKIHASKMVESRRELNKAMSGIRGMKTSFLNRFKADKKHDIYWPQQDWVQMFNNYVVKKYCSRIYFNSSFASSPGMGSARGLK